jgi:hypothetical protein
LSVPLTTNQTSCDLLITERVRLIRSRRWLGRGSYGDDIPFSVGRGVLGEDRGHMAVWSHAEQADIEDNIAKLAPVRFSGVVEVKAGRRWPASRESGRD